MKNILVLMHDDPGQEARLQAALDVARATGGHLTCLDVTRPPILSDDPLVISGTGLFVAERENEAGNRARTEPRLIKEDVPFDWIDTIGEFGPALVDAATLVDLIVVNRGFDAVPDMLGAAGDAVVESGKPVLAVPQDARGIDLAGPVLVAWDGSDEAGAALKAATPLLARATAVTLLYVDDGSLRASAEDAAAYLSRHGVHPEVVTVPARERPSGVLLAEVNARRPAWVVMGGYGRSRLAESIFGGVTRRMLAESPVPLFLAH